jgi:hypothetical protein
MKNEMEDSKQAVLFVNKKKAPRRGQDNFDLRGVLAPRLPQPPFNRRFLLLFFKKEVLSSAFKRTFSPWLHSCL